MDYSGRMSRLIAQLPELGVDALLVSRMTNIRYLTGFTGTTAYLVVATEPLLAVDFRYREQVRDQVKHVDIRESVSSRELWPDTLNALKSGALKNLGVESGTLTVDRFLQLSDIAGVSVVPTENAVERLRYRKDDREIAAIRAAAQIADEVAEEMIGVITAGMSEHQIAGEIELRQRSRGGERSASEIIVASGPRSSLPHGIATSRTVGPNEPVMLDLGTAVDGYLSDLTRTYHVGSPGSELGRIHQVVAEAQQRALEAIRPGMTGREADAFARDHIRSQGYGDYFGHSLGHSIGLDNHETPLLSPYDETVLEPGMVTTVEPGIYVPGVGGVRIEDMVVITDNGCELLTNSRRDFVQL